TSRFLSLQLWMARAKTSFPVPLSPRSKIVDLLTAAFFAVSIANLIFGLSPPPEPISLTRLLGKAFQASLKPLDLQRLSHDHSNMVKVKRLANKIKRTFLHRLHGPLDRAVSRDHDNRRVASALAHFS